MTRGNQREKAREKNQKKQKEASKANKSGDKAGNKGASMEQRKHRDAEIMRQKQMAASGDNAGGGATGGK
ncbi:hypothetical protein ScPMuIL_018904 [Solemya velum]